jgi:hypothetical protein
VERALLWSTPAFSSRVRIPLLVLCSAMELAPVCRQARVLRARCGKHHCILDWTVWGKLCMISREWNGTYSMILISIVTHDHSECMHVAHHVPERLRPLRYLTARSRTVVHAFATRGKPSPSYINPFPQHFLQISSFNLLMRAERTLPRRSYLGVTGTAAGERVYQDGGEHATPTRQPVYVQSPFPLLHA